MPLDLSTIPPEMREALIDTGRDFSSTDVLRQIEKMLNANTVHGTYVLSHGFTASQVEMAGQVRDALLAAGVARDRAKTQKKATNAALLDAMRAGKNARFTARSSFSSALFELALTGNVDAVNAIKAALDATSSAGSDAKKLRDQLELLAGLLEDEAIRGKTPDAENLRTTLTSRAAAIDIARQNRTTPAGTPVETEDINLIDGLGVELVRLARKAARAAARALGQPAIADAYELDELYQATGRKKSTTDPNSDIDAT